MPPIFLLSGDVGLFSWDYFINMWNVDFLRQSKKLPFAWLLLLSINVLSSKNVFLKHTLVILNLSYLTIVPVWRLGGLRVGPYPLGDELFPCTFPQNKCIHSSHFPFYCWRNTCMLLKIKFKTLKIIQY